MTPAQVSSTVDIRVTTYTGTSTTSGADQFTYNTETWTGAGDGSSWNDAANWSTGILPTAWDVVVIPYYYDSVTLSSGSASVYSLTVDGTLTVSGGSMSVAHDSSIYVLNISGTGVLTTDGTLTVTSYFTWAGGTIAGSGNFVLGSSSNSVVGVGSQVVDGLTFTNNGTELAYYGSTLELNDAATLVNTGDFVFSLSSTVTSTTDNGSIYNEGSIWGASGSMVSVAVTDAGSIYGTLTFEDADFTLLNGASAYADTFDDEALHLANGNSATITDSTFTDTTLDGGGTLILSSPTISGSNTWDDVCLSGTVSGDGAVTIGTLLEWTGGTMTGSGTVTVSYGATLELDSGDVTLDGWNLNTGGVTDVTGTGNVLFASDSEWHNLSTGELDLHVDGSFTGVSGSGTGSFVNDGVFLELSGSTTATFGWTIEFDNHGDVQVQHGTLQVQGGGTTDGTLEVSSGTTFAIDGDYTLTSASAISGSGAVDFQSGTITASGSISAGAGITVESGAEVIASGTWTAEITNDGTIDVGGTGSSYGTLAIVGDFTNSSSGTLNIQIGGTTPGTNYDQLTVSGTASLDGTLNIAVASGYTPGAYDTFTLLTYSSETGSFATINGLDQGSYSFTTSYGASAFTLGV